MTYIVKFRIHLDVKLKYIICLHNLVHGYRRYVVMTCTELNTG